MQSLHDFALLSTHGLPETVEYIIFNSSKDKESRQRNMMNHMIITKKQSDIVCKQA